MLKLTQEAGKNSINQVTSLTEENDQLKGEIEKLKMQLLQKEKELSDTKLEKEDLKAVIGSLTADNVAFKR